MKADHIRLGEQLGQVHIGANLPALCALRRTVGQHPHPHGPGNPAHLAADPAEPNDPQGLSRQLHQRALPIAPLRAVLPLPLMDGAVMQGHLAANLQQQGNGELGHRVSSIGRYIAHRNSPGAGIVHVDDVVSRG